jgi:hypothetical protein
LSAARVRLPLQRAFLIGTAIALAFVAAALIISARPAHAVAATTASAQVVAPADSASTGQSTLQAAVQDASADQTGWVPYAVFAAAFGAMVLIGTGLVPRRRS